MEEAEEDRENARLGIGAGIVGLLAEIPGR